MVEESVFGIAVLRTHLSTFLRRGDVSRFCRINRQGRDEGRPILRPHLQDRLGEVVALNDRGALRAIPDGLWCRLQPFLFPRLDDRSNIMLLDIEDNYLADLVRPGAKLMTIMPLIGLNNNTYGKVVLYLRCYRKCILYDSIVVLGVATQNWRPIHFDPVRYQLENFLQIAGLSHSKVADLTRDRWGRPYQVSTFPGGGARDRVVGRYPAALAYLYAHNWMANPLPSEEVPRHTRSTARDQDLFNFIFLQVGRPADIE
jgi:hypothetical protein